MERRGGGAYVSCVSATKESNVPVRAKPVGDNGPLMSKNLEKKHNNTEFLAASRRQRPHPKSAPLPLAYTHDDTVYHVL